MSEVVAQDKGRRSTEEMRIKASILQSIHQDMVTGIPLFNGEETNDYNYVKRFNCLQIKRLETNVPKCLPRLYIHVSHEHFKYNFLYFPNVLSIRNFHFPFFVKHLFLIGVVCAYCTQFRNMRQYKKWREISQHTTQNHLS